LEQAEQFFRALQHFHVPSEFVIFPRENHDLTRNGEPKHLVESLKWQVYWFERYLDGNTKAAPPDAPAIGLAWRRWPVLPGTYPAGAQWAGRDGMQDTGPVPVHKDWQDRIGTQAEQVASWWAGRPYSLLLATGADLRAAVGIDGQGVPGPAAQVFDLIRFDLRVPHHVQVVPHRRVERDFVQQRTKVSEGISIECLQVRCHPARFIDDAARGNEDLVQGKRDPLT